MATKMDPAAVAAWASVSLPFFPPVPCLSPKANFFVKEDAFPKQKKDHIVVND